MFKTLLGWIFSRWTLAVVGLLALSAVIWWIGPIVAIGAWRPLGGETVRWICIGLAWLLVLGALFWQRWRAGRRNQAVVEQLMTAPAAAQPAESADLASVRERFQKALATLRKARFDAPAAQPGAGRWAAWRSRWSARVGGRYLYELPWYLIIGAPGSGKTTALRNAGLHFPLGDALGQERVRGVGGTRDCDWWFTSQAVLIDTAGRFTTQDSDAARDRETWSGFLGLLRKARPRQPINGVLVTVSAQDLLGRSAADREEQAARVRLRLQELSEQLGIRFPIYLLVTKTDLLPGFAEYFALLDKETRATPWGVTLPLGADGEPTPDGLDGLPGEIRALSQRLQAGVVERLQAEPDAQRRQRIYGFPLQFAALQELLQPFVRDVFAASPLETPAFLRGVYFISGTQEGTPIDRLLGSIARGWQLERAMLPPLQASGRSYFLERLLAEVVFAEAGLAGTQRRWERRRSLLLGAGYALLALLAVGALAAWVTSWLGNRRYVDEVQARVEQVRKLVQATPNRATPDLLPLLPALAATRELAQAGRVGGDVPLSLGFGLFQGHKLDAASRTVYERMLVDAVLPRLALRIEEQLRQRADAPELQYESLKAYLMLHDPQHFDAKALGEGVRADWEANLPRSVGTAERTQLLTHLDALLALGPAVSPLPLDQALVNETRARLAALPLPQRVYTRLRQQGIGAKAADFTIAQAGGPAASLVFARHSGEPIAKGVPGLFTRAGYREGLQRQVESAARELAEEQSWVLGLPAGDAAGRASAQTLADDVRRLYLTDYANTWEAFIADVRLRPAQGLPDLVQLTRVLSGPDNPLGTLLKAIVKETTLIDTPAPGSAQAALSDKVRDVTKAVKEGIAGVVGEQALPPELQSGPRLEAIVDDRFALLRRYVLAPPGGKAPLDEGIALLNEVQLYMAAVELAVRSASPLPPSDLPVRLGAEAARAAEPARGLLSNLGKSSAGFTGLLQRDQLSREVKSAVGDFCNQAVAGRYPLNPRSLTDVTAADFGQLFGPGGRIDRIFQEKLAAHVDTSARPVWRFRNATLGDDAGTLPQFQRAQAIRETFFAAGGNTPGMRLEFKPVEMDATITQFVLDVDGQVLRYAHGPQIPTSVQWPGPRGTNQVRLQLSPPGASGNGLATEGPWALHHLFDRMRIEPGRSPERFRVTFELDGRKAVFEVTASSVRNPLRLRELTEFSCPNGL
ncbi:MAG TPA: type VI secretion system membrane subunit TssM [Burkholderiaceae bacterium]|nr:type VI secretion system membrane subunit TssM [Burkholderiaceae bacterium]HNG78005.1 type VI secretion system membrane subunit TssM [Burkholderiaceae bacterium]